MRRTKICWNVENGMEISLCDGNRQLGTGGKSSSKMDREVDFNRLYDAIVIPLCREDDGCTENPWIFNRHMMLESPFKILSRNVWNWLLYQFHWYSWRHKQFGCWTIDMIADIEKGDYSVAKLEEVAVSAAAATAAMYGK